MKHAFFPGVLLLAGALVFPLSPARAAETVAALAVSPALLRDLSEQLRTNNPALRAAYSRAEAAGYNVSSVRKWEDPTLKLGGTLATARGMEVSRDGDLSYGVEQPLPLFGKPAAARKVAQAEQSTAELEADYRFQMLRLDLSQAVFRAALADRVLTLGEEDIDWLRQMATVAEEKYRAGTATQIEVLRMQNELSKRVTQQETDRNERLAAITQLNRLLSKPVTNDWPRLVLPGVANPMPYSPKLERLSLKFEARLKVLQQDVKRAQALVEQTRKQRQPQVSVGVEANHYSGDGGLREGIFTLGLSLPWFNGDKYRADVQREKSRLKAAQQEVEDYSLAVPADLRRVTLAIDSARRTALLYRDEVIPRSELAMTTAHENWLNSRGMFNDVMEARRMLVDGRLQEAKAIAGQYELLSELVLCCGLADFEALEVFGALPEAKATQP